MEEVLCYVLVTLTKNLSAFYKFMKTHQFQFYNDFSIWESPDPILWKKNLKNQKTVDLNYFKNHKEPVIYRNEPIKNHQFNGQLFDSFQFSENCDYVPKLVPKRPQLSPSQKLLPVCVCAGEGSALTRRLSSRVSISTSTPGEMDEYWWMDGCMDGGWRKEIRSRVSFKEFVM
jgi:hypothetical protein